MKSSAPSAPSASVAPRDRAAADIILALDTSTEFCSVAICLPLDGRDAGPHASAVVPHAADVAAAVASAVAAGAAWGDPDNSGSNPQRTIDPGRDLRGAVENVGSVRTQDDVARGLRFIVVERDTGAVSSTTILPAIDQVLHAAGVTLQDCAAVAFGAGPGSFTGLRTATGIVQGLAFGAGLPVLPVNTLMACAESARLQRTLGDCVDVIAAVDARMDECYHQAFRWEGEAVGWTAAEGPDSGARVGPPESIVAPCAAEADVGDVPKAPDGAHVRYAVVGNAVRVFGERLSVLRGATLSDADARPDAAAVASVAWHAWQAGRALPAALALPDYVRNKVAQTTAERERARQAKDAARGSV